MLLRLLYTIYLKDFAAFCYICYKKHQSQSSGNITEHHIVFPIFSMRVSGGDDSKKRFKEGFLNFFLKRQSYVSLITVNRNVKYI